MPSYINTYMDTDTLHTQRQCEQLVHESSHPKPTRTHRYMEIYTYTEPYVVSAFNIQFSLKALRTAPEESPLVLLSVDLYGTSFSLQCDCGVVCPANMERAVRAAGPGSSRVTSADT